MKRYYKVYAQGVEELHPVQRLSKPKLNDALWEAIDYQACNFLDDRYSGTFSGLPEAEAIKEEVEHIKADLENEEITDSEADDAISEKEEALHNLAYDLWDKGEELVAETGDLCKSTKTTRNQAGHVNGCKRQPARQG